MNCPLARFHTPTVLPSKVAQGPSPALKSLDNVSNGAKTTSGNECSLPLCLALLLTHDEPSLSRARHTVVCRPPGAQLRRPAQIEPSTFLPITAKARGTTPQHTAGRRNNNDICLESSRIPPSPAYRLPGQASRYRAVSPRRKPDQAAPETGRGP